MFVRGLYVFVRSLLLRLCDVCVAVSVRCLCYVCARSLLCLCEVFVAMFV